MVDTKKESKSKNKDLQEKLFVKKESGWVETKDKDKIFDYSKGYMDFLKKCKTEREVITFAEDYLKKNGFKSIETFTKLNVGDKVYMINKNKNIAAMIVGKEEQIHLIGSHVDSPRLDLKPYPMIDDSNLALMKTHYYGGIKKYQWVARGLAIHGILTLKGGKKVDIRVGDNPGDPVFIIPDLLPHLAQEQMKRDASKVITGEELNVVVGHMPVNDKEVSEKIKFEVMKYLNEKYGVTEEDLVASELEIVPKDDPADIGFDRALIGAYGQDDRICAYTSLTALCEAKPKLSTPLMMLFDKEEIGSEGDTGAKSRFTELFLEKIQRLRNAKMSLNELFSVSKVISADVTAGVNPMFKDVHDSNNCSLLGNGVSVEKYGGGGGKYSTNDASAEYMRYILDLFNNNNVKWQSGELGRVDLGGGGTIAVYFAEKGCEVVDIGPCLVGMHSPFEMTSKYDVYQAYLGYKAFFND